jgi:DUF1365 family protein
MALLNSASLLFGQVFHERRVPKKNKFNYGVFFIRIPMRSRHIDKKLLSQSGIGDNQFSWISFYDKDHGDGNAHSLIWAENILDNAGLKDVDGEIWLHTFPRVLGYVFNPVSFWFCHNSVGSLKAVLAEVNNTFGERHTYLLQPQIGKTEIAYGESLESKKIFHVSPFFDLKGEYVFHFMKRENSHKIGQSKQHSQHLSKIEYFVDRELQLITSISGKEYPITRSTRLRAILSFPALTFGIIFKIHWQALILWLKGVSFYKKPPLPPTHIS